MTPAPVESHATVAVKVALVPYGTGFGEIVTTTEIGVILTIALTDFVLSATEVAVKVTVPPGGIAPGAA
jgi:hypothetical protein